MTSIERNTIVTESPFYYVIAVCLRLALSFQLGAGIAGMPMVPEVYYS